MKRRIWLIALIGLLVIVASTIQARSAHQAVAVAAAPQYEDVRIEKFPIAVQCWTYRAFTFMETLEKVKALGISYLQPYPGQRLSEETGDLRFDHNMSEEHMRLVRGRLREAGLGLVAYGVVNFENTEESARKVFDFARRMRIRTIVTEPDTEDFSLLEKLVQEYDIHVAIHNHPAPSTYARPETVLERVDGRDPRIGSCADTGHWMRTGVNPVEALRMLKGRIHDVHLKDLDTFGERRALDVPFGSGLANIRDILAELTLQGFQGYLTIEHEHPDEVENPEPSIIKGLEYIQSVTYWEGYERILSRTGRGYSKNGWNHYGPGVFELDRQTGVLTGRGGMGLFWYGKKYKNFILELDYRCSEERTNSGIFIRVPEVPISDDYIYHSWEIQIADDSEGVHMTGAVYDAEPATAAAFKPTGEWNHIKITFVGKHIEIELNGQVVVQWDAEPRGKVADFAEEGYIGLQNHDWDTTIQFRNIRVRELP